MPYATAIRSMCLSVTLVTRLWFNTASIFFHQLVVYSGFLTQTFCRNSDGSVMDMKNIHIKNKIDVK